MRDELTPLARLIHEAIGDGSIQSAAEQCGVPRWIIDDALRGRVPRDRHLEALASGLGISYADLALAAHGIDPRAAARPRTARAAS